MLDSLPVAAACAALVTVPESPADHEVHQTVHREDDLVPALLPAVFRVVNLTRLPGKPGAKVFTEATLFHNGTLLRVFWHAQHVDVTIKLGSLVSIRWNGRAQSVDGAVRISRLVVLTYPLASLNLFDTVPTDWVKDAALLARASAVCEHLSAPFLHLFNTLFWEDGRFKRYLTGPSSLNGHHNGPNGNFRHAVETAEQCLMLAADKPKVCTPVLVAAALLHDAGKADEYQLRPGRSGFQMSDRGRLVGHRHTILEWLAVARQRVTVPEAQYLGLLHALTAAKGVAWLGIREPVSLEAAILGAVDRLSGVCELVGRLTPESGFGGYHPHLGGQPYALVPVSASVQSI